MPEPKSKSPKMGRPKMFEDDVVFRVDVRGKAKLQVDGAPRAIINVMIDNGGKMSIAEINEHFGYDIRPKVFALHRSDWLSIVEKKNATREKK